MKPILLKNLKTLVEWYQLGFELKPGQPCLAIKAFTGEQVYAESQVQKKKKEKRK